MSPADYQIENIVKFLGYGRPSAPTWFVGLEEGLGGQTVEDSRKNLAARGEFAQIMDMREAHLTLWAGNKCIDITRLKKITPVWIWMGRFLRARDGANNWEDTDAAKEYVRCHLGRKDGPAFLTELSPIPRARQHDGRWKNIFHRPTIDLLSLLMQRRNDQEALYRKYLPSLVVCYSTSDRARSEFQSLFSIGRLIEAAPHAYISEDACFLVTPFFGNGRMSFKIARAIVDRGLLRGAVSSNN